MTPPRRRRTSREQDTPARILEAADELFAERGYAGASARDIAERAGVQKALVFYHFNSKEALFERVLERYYDAHARALASADSETGTITERLHRVIDAYLDFIEDNHRYPALVQRELTSGSAVHAPIQAGLTRLAEMVTEILGDLVPERGLRSARHFFVSFSAMVLNYYIYAPVLRDIWGEDPLSAAARRERREHLHWLIDTIVERLKISE